jgi:ATP-dependent protease ClpP protease subunit
MKTKPASILRVRAFAPSEGEADQPTHAELLIYGDIGETWDGVESTPARQVVEQLGHLVDVGSIHVRINSYGGSVTDGLAIYHALITHPATITVTIDGVAASIASLIAMAGSEVRMHPSSLMMLHAPWGGCTGNRQEMATFIAELDRWAAAMARAYSLKSGKTEDEIMALLTDGVDHWYTAEEAIAEGFADTLVSVGADTEIVPASDDVPADDPAFANGLARYADRAPLPIAARLRVLSPRGFNMPNQTQPATVLAAEQARRTDIRSRFYGFTQGTRTDRDDIVALQRLCEDDPAITPDEAGQRLLAYLGRGAEPLGRPFEASLICYQTGHDARASFVNAATDALVMRSGIRVENPVAGARDLLHMGVTELARACVSRAGRTVDGMGKSAAIRAALSTSDFPLILENTLNKALRSGYENEPRTHEAWTSKVTVDDFRPQKRPILGSAPDLLPVLEGGEYQYGSLDEDRSVPYAVGKFGRITRLTWETFVNDDLGAFARTTSALGQAAARAEADQVYSSFGENAAAGPTMQDGVALFHADHSNLAASSALLDAAALGAARVLLRRQTAVGGGQLNLVPRFLLVAPEFEQQAEILLAASARSLNQGTNNALVPEWLSNLTLVVEARLTDDAVYLLGGISQIDTVERAWLAADNGPVIQADESFNTDDIAYKVRHVFGSRWLDWRGAVKIPISGG